jgi:hypothetical protein
MRRENREGGDKEMSMPSVIDKGYFSPMTSKKRKIKRSSNLSKLSSKDFKEMNEVTKRGRGLSSLSLREILGEENI